MYLSVCVRLCAWVSAQARTRENIKYNINYEILYIQIFMLALNDTYNFSSVVRHILTNQCMRVLVWKFFLSSFCYDVVNKWIGFYLHAHFWRLTALPSYLSSHVTLIWLYWQDCLCHWSADGGRQRTRDAFVRHASSRYVACQALIGV